MLETIGLDIFDQISTSDALCIATNCAVLEDGTNPMGAMAGVAARRWNDLPYHYGALLQAVGAVPVIIGYIEKCSPDIFFDFISFRALVSINLEYITDFCALVAYPTMYDIGEPADLDLVVRSAKLLVEMTNTNGWQKVVLGRSGCGAGGLDWETQVKPATKDILDDRFTCMHK